MSDHPDAVCLPITLRHEHRLIFTRDVFAENNPVLAGVLTPREPGESVRAMVFWDAGLAPAFPGIGEKSRGGLPPGPIGCGWPPRRLPCPAARG